MLTQIFAVISPVLICAIIGFVWARRGHNYDSQFVSSLVFNVGAPCLVVSSISQVQLDTSLLWQMALAALFTMVALLLLGWLIIRVQGHDFHMFLPSLVFPNVGNMGLPLCWFAFGDQGLALAVAYFMVTSILHFSLGMALGSGDKITAEHFLKNPIMWSIVIAVALVITNTQLPQWAANSVKLIGNMTIPLMLITLGVSLAQLKLSQWRLGLFYSSLRLILGGAVALAAVWYFQLEGAAMGVVLVQGIMPVAVFNYLFALRYDEKYGGGGLSTDGAVNEGPATGSSSAADQVASMVLISTLMSVGLLPFLLGYLLG